MTSPSVDVAPLSNTQGPVDPASFISNVADGEVLLIPIEPPDVMRSLSLIELPVSVQNEKSPCHAPVA